MNLTEFDERDRGQVGIGTLIVFIALVLVAAIAAGVLINTAGFLQTQAEDTGTESTEQVADNLNVITEVGTVSDANSNNISDLRIGVQPAAGASDINLAELSIQLVSDDNFANLVAGNDTNGDPVSGDTDPGNVSADSTVDPPEYGINVTQAESEGDLVMTDNSDRYEIVITSNNTDSNAQIEEFEEGEDIELTITTEQGAQTQAFLTVPDSLTDKDGGDSVNL